MRYEDPRGDLGRAGRQRQILKAVIQKSVSPGNVMEMDTLLDQIGSTVKTNLHLEEPFKWISDYRPAIDKIENLEIKGNGKMIDGIYYYIVDESERKRIGDVVRQHLGVE
jgi:anionic cell wall polymer biosynthesis LytR-Cps2A-Psr (LCP) family protein